MSRGKRELSGEEKKLWRRVAAGVKLRRPRLAEAEPNEAPRPTVAHVAAKQAPPASPAGPPGKADAPLQDRAGEKRVRRGKVEIGATLDLHGHTQDRARAALVRFLRAAQARGEAAVLVVTGVGRSGEGMLKRRLPEWLASPEVRPLVSGFAQAHRAHGGAGAFYVFVKRRAATSR